MKIDRFRITYFTGGVRANVWTARGASSKTCLNDAEAFDFIRQVEAQGTWVRGKRV